MKLKNQYVFESINELIETLDKSEELDRMKASERKDSDNWDDTGTYEEARKRMLEGYEYNISSEVEKYESFGTGSKPKQYLSVAGHQVIVPLYLQGIPNNMLTKKTVINNKIVTLIYECSAPWHVSAEEILKTTKKFFEKIVKLEKEGYRCNVWVIETNEDYNGKWGFALKLKTDREILNMKKMMFPLISPSFLRRIGFRIKERLYKDWIGGSYGRASFDKEIVDKFIQKNLRISKYEIWNYEGQKN